MTLPLKHRSDGPKFQHLSYTTLTLWVMTLYFLLVPTEQQPNAPGYLGCFVDCPGGQPCSGRALRTGIRDVDVEYIELCFRICLDGIGGRYKYAGLDFANKCFCGNNENFGRFGRRSDSECHDRCGANQDQICGDASRISVYQISQSVCNNDIGPPTNGAHTIIDPLALFYNLNNFKFFGTRVDFSCDVGYTLRGASSIECIDTGYNNVTWSDSVPTCEASDVDFTTQTQAESSRTNENTTKTVTERPSSKNAPGYLGCFFDCKSPCRHALPIGPLHSEDQSSEWCFKQCLEDESSSHNYAGLADKSLCFCGEDYDTAKERPVVQCQDSCLGNSNQICGDTRRMSLYRISQGVCSNDIGPPTNGDHTITNPRSLDYNLNNFKFFGTRVDFSCDVGYTLRGASSIECVDTGYNNVTWSDSVPTCEASVVDFTTQTQAESSRTNENTTKTVTERPSSKNVELSTAVPPAVSIRTRLSRWSKGSTTMVKSTVPETQENEKRDKPLDRVVFVVSLVAGFITGLVALAVIVVFVRWHKRQLVRNDSTRELCHQSESLAGDSRVSSTRAAEHLTDIPLTAMVTLTAKDYCPEHDKSVQVAYGNTGPDLSFSRDLVEIEGEIGRGTFGIVLLGTALGIEEVGKQSKVAIKTIKEGADRQAKMVLLEELDITKKIGSHPNIVRLLGYCIEADPIYIILEYLGKGDLKKVLMGFRNTNTNGRYANISGPSRSLSLRLLKFARDVADGMTFLASQKCIHRDLAARNVLVDDNMVCKVSDFGLARDVINIRVYRQGSKGPLPMRWMALESLLDDVYTIQSDVWSFGILMWEIVTLGARPYPHIMTAKDMVNQLSEGYRMSRPTNCNTQLYSIMRSCWHADPRLRPTFQEVLDKLEGLLTVEMGYVTIDDIDESIYDDTEIIHD